MKMLSFFLCCCAILFSCKQKNASPSPSLVRSLDLKRGELVACGPTGNQYGTVSFLTSCSDSSKQDFNMAMAMLHSFEYDEAEKLFARIIDKEPGCAMAYWGVAMCNNHPLWSPPNEKELEKGAKAIDVARSLSSSKRESEYIDAMYAFYKDHKTVDHHTRTIAFENSMEKIYKDYPDDKEAAILYCLALDAAADPSDKTYSKQKKAGSILTSIYPNEPFHPGILHYIIHTYDNPEMASLALPAARKYASIAPSSSHAQHMPSHIFTRLGLWDECIGSNLQAQASAKCYAEGMGLKGHWDEELHALDYLTYAYLQKGDNQKAKEVCDYVAAMKEVDPPDFKVAYAFAAIPARYVLENRLWKEASNLQLNNANLKWDDFPWQKAMLYYTRLLGDVHTGQLDSAAEQLKKINSIHDLLLSQKDSYKATQVGIQLKTGEAWIEWKKGNNKKAEELMLAAADMEDHTEKHPVTPGELLPARELLGDLYMEMNLPQKAREAYEASLKVHPNRANGIKGLELAKSRLK